MGGAGGAGGGSGFGDGGGVGGGGFGGVGMQEVSQACMVEKVPSFPSTHFPLSHMNFGAGCGCGAGAGPVGHGHAGLPQCGHGTPGFPGFPGQSCAGFAAGLQLIGPVELPASSGHCEATSGSFGARGAGGGGG